MVLLWLDLHALITNHLLKEQTILLSHPDSPFKFDNLKILYTNADQFLNEVHDLEIFIAGNEHDLMLISEILPKNRSAFVDAESLIISVTLCILILIPMLTHCLPQEFVV